MITRRTGLKLLGAAGATLAAPPIMAQDGTVHVVEMLNRHPDLGNMVYDPPVVRAMPGDTIQWVSTDRGHNSQSMDGMLPDGVEPWKSDINADFELVVEAEGAYGYICTPHSSTGMVGLILVGQVDNLDQLKEVRQRGRARQRFEEYFVMAEEMLAAEA